MVRMKKTLNIDARLLAEARKLSGAATDTETIHLGLRELVRRDAYQRLRRVLGSEPGARDVARRREEPRKNAKARRATASAR